MLIVLSNGEGGGWRHFYILAVSVYWYTCMVKHARICTRMLKKWVSSDIANINLEIYPEEITGVKRCLHRGVIADPCWQLWKIGHGINAP